MATHEGLHEPRERLSENAQDRHRARVSLNEELEAIDWYDQRIEATRDADLRAILQHNRDEETEHAVLLVDWLRKHDAVLDAELTARVAPRGSGSGSAHGEAAGKHGHERKHGGSAGGSHDDGGAHLRRDDAPFAASVWERIDEEAQRALNTYGSARKLVEVDGPHGWLKSSVRTGRVAAAAAEALRTPGIELDVRRVQPLLEIRVPFRVPRSEIAAIERGAEDPDFQSLIDACGRIARAEDRLVFHGFGDAGVGGIVESSPHAPLPLPTDMAAYPAVLAEALERLRSAGVAGPYALALGARAYDNLARFVGPGGYPLLDHVRKLLGGNVVWAPALEGGGVVTSMRGGDYRLVIGQDVSIGYRGHDANDVLLYAEETATFRLLSPEAAVALVGA